MAEVTQCHFGDEVVKDTVVSVLVTVSWIPCSGGSHVLRRDPSALELRPADWLCELSHLSNGSSNPSSLKMTHPVTILTVTSGDPEQNHQVKLLCNS